VRLAGGDAPALRLELACDVADRRACAGVLRALGQEREGERCAPVVDSGGRISISGTIEGREVRAVLRRRTDCEARRYQGVLDALRD
jgi:hypothetical protein